MSLVRVGQVEAWDEAPDRGRRRRPGRGSGGLVGQVTSLTYSDARDLNTRRRVRRMRRVVIAAADASRDVVSARGHRVVAVMVTLTYRPEVEWSRKQVSGYVQAVRAWLRRRGQLFGYQWVLELTQAGRPHYHVVFWLRKGVRIPKPDSSGQWPHGMTRIVEASKPVGYLVKYVSKGTLEGEHEVPKGARLFGAGSQAQEVKHARHRAGLPLWLHDATAAESRVARETGVGWVERMTGEIFQSPFVVRVYRERGRVVIVVRQREFSNDAG